MKRPLRLLGLLVGLFVLARPALAQTDVANAREHPLFPRMPDYIIWSYEERELDEVTFRPAPDAEPRRFEGHVVRQGFGLLRAASQAGRMPSALQVMRFYAERLRTLGGTVAGEWPVNLQMTGRVIRDGREYWLHVQMENVTEFGVTVVDFPATDAVAAGPAPVGVRAGVAVGVAAGAPMVSVPRRIPARGSIRLPRLAAPPALNLAPLVEAILPERRKAGEQVRLAGSNLARATAVRFVDARGESWPAQVFSYEACSDNLRVVLPSMPATTYRVAVTTPMGSGQSTATLSVYQEPIHSSPDAGQRLRVASRRIVETLRVRNWISVGGAAALRRRIDVGEFQSPGALLDAAQDIMVSEAETAVGGPVSESVIIVALQTGKSISEIALQWRHCHDIVREVGIGMTGGQATVNRYGIGNPPPNEGGLLGACGARGGRWHAHVVPMSIATAVDIGTAIRSGTAPRSIPAHMHTETGFPTGDVYYAPISDDAWYSDFVDGAMSAYDWLDEHRETIISVAKISGYVVLGTVGCAVAVVVSAGAGCAPAFIAVAGPIAKESAKILVQEEVVTVEGVPKETLLMGIDAIPVG